MNEGGVRGESYQLFTGSLQFLTCCFSPRTPYQKISQFINDDGDEKVLLL